MKRILPLFLLGFSPALLAQEVCGGEFGCGYAPEDKAEMANVPLSQSSVVQHRGLPSSVNLSRMMPPPGSQGRQGSCVAWSTTYATKSYHEKRKQKWQYDPPFDKGKGDHVFSPAFTYNQINGGYDKGSSVGRALDLLVKTGAVPWSVMPYKDRDYLTKPSPQALVTGKQYRAKSFAQVRLTGVEAIKAELAAGNPVVGGFKVYRELRAIRQDVMDAYTGDVVGGHAMAIVGYDDSRVSPKGYRGAFLIQNSWGKGWGEQGFGWISYEVILQLLKYAFVLYDSEGDLRTEIKPPATVSASRGTFTDRITVRWDSVANASAYEIERRLPGDASQTEFQPVGYSDKNTFDDLAVEKEVAYSYRVIAINQNEKSSRDESPVAEGYAAAVKVKPGPVTSLRVSVTGRVVALTWDPSEGATAYTVARADSYGAWQVLSSSGTASFTDAAAPPGRIAYSVAAVSASGRSDAALAYADVSAPGLPPSRVEGLTASDGAYGDRIELTWKKADGAAKYLVYRYDFESQSFAGPFENEGTSFIDRDGALAKEKPYAYTVLAANDNGYAEYSAYATGRLHPTARGAEAPHAPAGVKAGMSGDRVRLTWKPVAGISKYNVFRKKKNERTMRFVSAVTGTEFAELFPGDPGELYFYTVRSQSELAGESADSSPGVVFKNAIRTTVRSVLLDDADRFTGTYRGSLWQGGSSARPLSVNITRENQLLRIKLKEGNLERQFTAKAVTGSSVLEAPGFTFVLDTQGKNAKISTAAYDEHVTREGTR